LLEHILEHGQVTTEELKNIHGLDHPPRAAKDVTDRGIPLAKVRVKSSTGRSIVAYGLGQLSGAVGSSTGRTALPRTLKDALIRKHGAYCANCNGHFEHGRGLQVDHRVPYEIGGDTPFSELDSFMLLCGSCNRQKSFTCELCVNWTKKQAAVCQGCLWTSPQKYSHIAAEQRRQLTVTWIGEDTAEFDCFEKEANRRGLTPAEAAREALSKFK
jgi:hypothetical protein